MAISGTGVAMATAGGVLVYAGLKHESPLAALREIMSGHPSPVASSSAYQATQSSDAGASAAYVPSGDPAPSGGALPQLVNAAYTFQGDKYSQARRWQNGYSDCSSFVGKAFRAIGITPPGASTTASYLSWGMLTKIPMGSVGAGDLLCNATHVVIAINGSTAIGQENPRVNVQVGPISSLMAGTGAYVALRYTGQVRVQGPGLQGH